MTTGNAIHSAYEYVMTTQFQEVSVIPLAATYQPGSEPRRYPHYTMAATINTITTKEVQKITKVTSRDKFRIGQVPGIPNNSQYSRQAAVLVVVSTVEFPRQQQTPASGTM